MNIVSSLACCANCLGFIKDTIGDGHGIGSCNTMEAWLDKFDKRRPPPKKYDDAYARTGGKVYYPKILRDCEKFETKKSPESGQGKTGLSKQQE